MAFRSGINIFLALVAGASEIRRNEINYKLDNSMHSSKIHRFDFHKAENENAKPELLVKLTLTFDFFCSDTYYGETCSIKCIPKPANFKCDPENGQKLCLLNCLYDEHCYWNVSMFICVKIVDVRYQGCSPRCKYPEVCKNGLCVCPLPFKAGIGTPCVCDQTCPMHLNVPLYDKDFITSYKGDRCNWCGRHATCSVQSPFCKCDIGYEGDPFKGCTKNCSSGYEWAGEADGCQKSCTNCPLGQMCRNGRCIYAFIGRDGNRRCKPGYLSDDKGCVREICSTPCHRGALCINGKCICMEPFVKDGDSCKCGIGYHEEPKWGCLKNKCTVTKECHREARCIGDKCLCISPFTGDGFSCRCSIGFVQKADGGCRKAKVCKKPCNLKRSKCKDGECICISPYISDNKGNCICPPGLYDDPDDKCIAECEPECSPFGHCNHSICECNSGFTGTGIACYNCSQCVANSICDWRNEKCQCKSGFHGNAIEVCSHICAVPCHPNADCFNGTCVCRNGYKGDGERVCADCSLCKAANSSCTGMGCVCNEGFVGNAYKYCYEKNICHDKVCPPLEECSGRNGKCICRLPLVSQMGYCKCPKPDQEIINGTCVKSLCSPPCPIDAECLKTGKCRCLPPFIGDGFQCKCPPPPARSNASFTNQTDAVRRCNASEKCTGCNNKANCDNSMCVCNFGFTGDGVYHCFPCGICAPGAKCNVEREVCECPTWFQGSPYKECIKKPWLTCIRALLLIVGIEMVLIIIGPVVRFIPA